MIVNIFFRELPQTDKEDSLTISVSVKAEDNKSLKAKSLPMEKFSEEEQKIFNRLIEIIDKHKNIGSIEAKYSL